VKGLLHVDKELLFGQGDRKAKVEVNGSAITMTEEDILAREYDDNGVKTLFKEHK